jgi:hypothetical protein
MKKLLTNLWPFTADFDCFLAGGAVLSHVTKKEISDYDVYPKSREAAIDIVGYLLEDESCFVVNLTDRALTLKCNGILNDKGERAIVQVMLYDTFETAEKIFQNFDFSITMGALCLRTGEEFYGEDFWRDIASHTLRVNVGTKYPLNTLIRVGKCREKGYFLAQGELLKIAMAVTKCGLPTTWGALEDAIGGTYGRSIAIDSKDLDCTYKNIIDVLSNLNVSFDLGQDFSYIKAENFEVLVFPDPAKKLYKVDTEVLSKFLVNEEGFLVEKPLSPNAQYEDWPNDYIHSYKKLTPSRLADGIYHGAIYGGAFEYRLGLNTENRHPGLFSSRDKSYLGATYPYNSQDIIIKVKIPIKSIKSIFGIQGREIKSSEILIDNFDPVK